MHVRIPFNQDDFSRPIWPGRYTIVVPMNSLSQQRLVAEEKTSRLAPKSDSATPDDTRSSMLREYWKPDLKQPKCTTACGRMQQKNDERQDFLGAVWRPSWGNGKCSPGRLSSAGTAVFWRFWRLRSDRLPGVGAAASAMRAPGGTEVPRGLKPALHLRSVSVAGHLCPPGRQRRTIDLPSSQQDTRRPSTAHSVPITGRYARIRERSGDVGGDSLHRCRATFSGWRRSQGTASGAAHFGASHPDESVCWVGTPPRRR